MVHTDSCGHLCVFKQGGGAYPGHHVPLLLLHWEGKDHCVRPEDVGMLLTGDTHVQMEYYHDFLETMTGKDTPKEALLRISILVFLHCSLPFEIPPQQSCQHLG